MRRDFLLLMIIIICTAAGAAVTYALTAPSGTEGTVEACFVSKTVYEELTAGKEKVAFDASSIEFEGEPLPLDKETGTIFIPQSCSAADWEGKLRYPEKGSRICILNEGEYSRQQCIEEGKPFKTAVVIGEKYMECSLVFSGLPLIMIEHGEESVEFREEYGGTIRVLDPYRGEYQDSLCSFHIRGNTSVLFDKMGYRVELCDSTGNTVDRSFLGMRSDDDWVLNPLSTDRTLSREKVCYEIWERLNEMEGEPVASSHIEFAELFINSEYQGVYGFMYPVDGKLMEMEPGDILYKVKTWKEEMDVPGRLTDHNGESEVLNTNGFAYASIKYPGEGPFIWDPFQEYQDMVFETGDVGAMEDAGVSVNRDNFILHELFCEMVSAGDNTWKNLFIAAYKDEEGGYVLNETVWDLNYTFGDRFTWDPDNGNTLFDAESTDEYRLRYERDYGYTVLAASDPDLRKDTGIKWRKWREEGISPEYAAGLFVKEREYLKSSGALKRNSDRWSAGISEEDFDMILKWIGGRFAFMDGLYMAEK